MSEIKIVENLKDIKLNGITYKYQEDTNVGVVDASYRFSMANYTKEILDCFFDVAREDDEDITNEEILNMWCSGNLPQLELIVEFGKELQHLNEVDIESVSVVYYFDDYETIVEFDRNEIDTIKFIIFDFVDEYGNKVPNHYENDYGDCEFFDAIPQEIKDEWDKI